MEILKSCPFEEPVGKYEIENDKPKMTNEEWFCQLPTWEKAEFFANIYPKSVGEALIKISNGDKEKWEKWLKEKHND